MSRRHYVDNAPSPTFGPVGTTDTSWVLSSAVGLPASFPFTATLDIGTASQENVLVTGITGSTVTVTRNTDTLGAFSHSAGATFTHTALAIDYDEANAHVNASSGVHGVTGSVVGTTDTQTLSNKTFAGVTFTADSGVVGITVTGDNTGDLIDLKNGSTTVAKFDKSGNLTAGTVGSGAITSTGAIAGTNVTASGTLAVTGNTTLTGTLGAGASTLASASVTGNGTVGGTLGVTGAVTLSSTLAAAASTLASASVTGNATVGGTLGVTGTSTLGVVNATSTAGRIIPPLYANEAARDSAVPSPTGGEVVSLTAPTTGAPGECIERWNGSSWDRFSAGGGAWTAYTPTWTNYTVGNGTVLANYRLTGKSLSLRIASILGSTSALSGALTVSIPSGMNAANDGFGQIVSFLVSGSSKVYGGFATIQANAAVLAPLVPTSATATDLSAFDTTSIALASDSSIYFYGTIQIA